MELIEIEKIEFIKQNKKIMKIILDLMQQKGYHTTLKYDDTFIIYEVK